MAIKHTQLQVLKGGLDKSITPCEENFIAGYVTDTRLMGVLVIGLLFGEGADPVKSIYQDPASHLDQEKTYRMFFYIDIEENGLETYKFVKGDDPDKAFSVEKKMIGGLGAKKIPVTLREAKWLLQHYAEYNRKHNLSLPKGYRSYGFLIDNKVKLSEPDQYILMKKQCVRLINNNDRINYFLMRCCGKDFDGARYLTDGNVEMELFPEYKAGTFYRNTITRLSADPLTFRCESLLEWGNNYYILVTRLQLENGLITGYERVSTFKISTHEAALLLAQSEYLDLITFDGELFDKTMLFSNLLDHASVKRYESGTLFMVFHKDNSHVAKTHYRLTDDMQGNIYITDSNQIILSANSLDNIWEINKLFFSCFDRNRIEAQEKMEFQDPVLYDFIQSGCKDFYEFLDIITDL